MARNLRNDLRLGALRRAFIENAGNCGAVIAMPMARPAPTIVAGASVLDLSLAPRPANQNTRSAEARTIG